MKLAFAWLDRKDPTDRSIAESLARELVRAGHEVCFVGPRRGSGEPFRSDWDGAPYYRVGPGEALAARQLARVEREEGIDLWHCHVFARDHRAFARAARRRRWRVLLSLHLVLKDYLDSLGGAGGLRALLGCAYHVALPAEAMRREFLGLFPGWEGACSVVHYGAPEPAGEADVPVLPAPYIASVARLAPYKGQDLLLMAFARLADEERGLSLVLCGRDQLNGALHGFAKRLGLEGRVILTGELAPAAVRGVLRRCEFVVHPSRRDNFPLAVLEAMAAGKAVIATRVGGLPEMLGAGGSGLLVEPNDVPALAEAMLRLCRDPKARERAGARARQASLRFTWKRAARDCESLYQTRP